MVLVGLVLVDLWDLPVALPIVGASHETGMKGISHKHLGIPHWFQLGKSSV
jgi:hypothetical protein